MGRKAALLFLGVQCCLWFVIDLRLSQQYSVYPIIWAAGRGHAEIVQLLLLHGAKVNCSDKVPYHSHLKKC